MPIITMIIIRLQWFTLLAPARCPTTILMTTSRMFDRVTAEQRHCLTIIMTITLTNYDNYYAKAMNHGAGYHAMFGSNSVTTCQMFGRMSGCRAS